MIILEDHKTRFLQAKLTRRTLLKNSILGVSGLVLSSQTLKIPSIRAAEAQQESVGLRALFPIPPLFCIAYINPDIPTQANQESIIARYPLAIVPQEMRLTHIKWKDRIRHLNPSILMLGYQMVIEETGVPGPGHEVMKKVKDSWCVYPNGISPTVTSGRPSGDLRIFDPRKVEWQQAFLEACRVTLKSYPYNGLFLDQCSVFEKSHPLPAVKAEMRQALQNTLLQLRHEFANIILIGNSSHNWQGLNGELNEGNPKTMNEELAPFSGHVKPNMDFYVSRLKNANDIEMVKREMALAHSFGAYYSAAVDYQHVLWFEAFDKLMAEYK